MSISESVELKKGCFCIKNDALPMTIASKAAQKKQKLGRCLIFNGTPIYV